MDKEVESRWPGSCSISCFKFSIICLTQITGSALGWVFNTSHPPTPPQSIQLLQVALEEVGVDRGRFLKGEGRERTSTKHLLNRGSKRCILKQGIPVYFLVVFKFSFRYILSSSCWVIEDGPAALSRPSLPPQSFRKKSKYCWRSETNVS